jgi:hypothetical protein
MNLINNTGMKADLTVAMDPTGREHVVVVVKGTFLIPDDGGEAVLAPPEQQVPLVMADTFTGAPGLSAPVYEAEFCLRKPRCDVLLLGTAYAPEGRPTARVRVGLKLGDWGKAFDVVGDRVWVQRGTTLGPSAPEPFTTMPITYDRAFGGVDDTSPENPDAYRLNPIGQGYGAIRSGIRLVGRQLPNTEDPHDPVIVPWGGYPPLSFGPIGRSWDPRLPLAGTYDQNWIDNTFPFLPPDFDEGYHQAAIPDQQISHPAGDGQIALLNLTPGGRQLFRLPHLDVQITFFRKDREHEVTTATMDILLVEPDLGRICLTFRSSSPLARNVFEIAEIVVGQMSRAWWRSLETGKTYYPSLGQLVSSRRDVEKVE